MVEVLPTMQRKGLSQEWQTKVQNQRLTSGEYLSDTPKAEEPGSYGTCWGTATQFAALRLYGIKGEGAEKLFKRDHGESVRKSMRNSKILQTQILVLGRNTGH